MLSVSLSRLTTNSRVVAGFLGKPTGTNLQHGPPSEPSVEQELNKREMGNEKVGDSSRLGNDGVVSLKRE